MKERNYKELRRKGIGPGGIDCPCCTDMGKKGTKIYSQRRTRRKMREELADRWGVSAAPLIGCECDREND